MIGYVSIRKQLLEPVLPFKNKLLHKMQIESRNWLKKFMPTAVRFNIGSASEFVENFAKEGGNLFSGQFKPEFAVPYPTMWVECTHGSEMGEVLSAALVASRVAPEGLYVSHTLCQCLKGENTWHIAPGLMSHLITEDKTNLVVSTNDNIFPSLPEDEVEAAQSFLEKVIKISSPAMTVTNALFLLLQCRNVITEEVVPSKSQKRRSKKPLLSYHILKIKPSKSNPLRDNTPLGGENRVHLCRGHFKTYTAERPLMGRFVGRYWWQPQARGRAKGIVLKDYEV